jgi:NO-binding membrane sensor protein with MHYT domain
MTWWKFIVAALLALPGFYAGLGLLYAWLLPELRLILAAEGVDRTCDTERAIRERTNLYADAVAIACGLEAQHYRQGAAWEVAAEARWRLGMITYLALWPLWGTLRNAAVQIAIRRLEARLRRNP